MFTTGYGCEKCPDPNMEYDGKTSKCKCKSGFLQEGESLCYKQEKKNYQDYKALLRSSDEFKFTYRNLLNIADQTMDAETNKEGLKKPSDILSQYFMKSAMEC
jgi:hypothetical protein